ncbi:MAG TPA: hypothetical protein VNO20_07240 [Solirubrobacterales bacterium]|nr:hypothetical protein [Solirubrobacterales bacterium]
MSAERNVPEPGELVYRSQPSWLPAILAFALALAVCGIFAPFMVPGWVYSVIGIMTALAVLRRMTSGAVREYFRLPRKQRVRGAVLPVEMISPSQKG